MIPPNVPKYQIPTGVEGWLLRGTLENVRELNWGITGSKSRILTNNRGDKR